MREISCLAFLCISMCSKKTENDPKNRNGKIRKNEEEAEEGKSNLLTGMDRE